MSWAGPSFAPNQLIGWKQSETILTSLQYAVKIINTNHVALQWDLKQNSPYAKQPLYMFTSDE